MRCRFRLIRCSLLFGCVLIGPLVIRELWDGSPVSSPPEFRSIRWQTGSLCSLQNLSKSGDSNENVLNRSRNGQYLRQFVLKWNSVQSVRNEEMYGRLPSPAEPDLLVAPDSVFVIQVHSRLENLRILIESLRQVKYIESSLIVFSSDLHSDEFIQLVDSIDFARTMKIFFPHSIQVFPDCFPGQSVLDCTGKRSDMPNSPGACPNFLWVDQYGNYRNSSFTQVKHHWLWKIRFVFENLVAISRYNGTVVFLEEDYYVVQDILHILRLLEMIWNPLEANGFLVLGSYANSQTYDNTVHTDYWVSSKHNLGMGISRAMWRNITACLHVFCRYDDYNWDFSLHHVSSSCLPSQLKALYFPSSSRVYHLGDCEGIHHRNENCSIHELAWRLTLTLSSSAFPHLYPERLNARPFASPSSVRFRMNGGWNDPRDHALCESMLAARWNDSIHLWAPHLTIHSPIY